MIRCEYVGLLVFGLKLFSKEIVLRFFYIIIYINM